MGDLSTLTFLVMRNNQLEGEIPESMDNLSNLDNLQLSNNQLSGTIPNTLGSLSKLKYFSLNYNQLEGGIPPSLGKLTNLLALDLSHNNLSGSIAILASLRDIGIEKNQIEDLPGLSNMMVLDWLVVKENCLTFEEIGVLGHWSNALFINITLLHHTKTPIKDPDILSISISLLLLDTIALIQVFC